MKGGMFFSVIWNATTLSAVPWIWSTGTGRFGLHSSTATDPATTAMAAMRSDKLGG